MDHVGSSYVGDYKNGRMEGNGNYKLQSGSMYHGEMRDGMYYGKGEFRFPNGSKYSGTFENGYPTSGTYIYEDGLQYADKQWLYCDGHDRRFASEARTRIEPADSTKQTDRPTRRVPAGHYDVGDGFYNPETRVVYDYSMRFLRNTDVSEHDWVIKHARKGWDEYTGGHADPCHPELSDPRMCDGDWIKQNMPAEYDATIHVKNPH